MEGKIISMYAKGMTIGDIQSYLNDLYGINVSDSTISRVTDKILSIVKEWQERLFRRYLCCSLFRRNTFSCKKRRQNNKKGCIYRTWT